jgi:hypothetical protein
MRLMKGRGRRRNDAMRRGGMEEMTMVMVMPIDDNEEGGGYASAGVVGVNGTLDMIVESSSVTPPIATLVVDDDGGIV